MSEDFNDEAYATTASSMRDDRVCPQTEAPATTVYAPVSALEEGYGSTRATKENSAAGNRRDPHRIYPHEDPSVGHLGTCRLCGKRWVFGACAHGGGNLEEVS